VKKRPAGSEYRQLDLDLRILPDSAVPGVDFGMALKYLDKVGSVSGLVEVEEPYGQHQ